MLRWRAAWAAAQITGVIVSSVVWIMVLGLSRTAAGVVLVLGVIFVLGRATRLGLRVRFGVRPATEFERHKVGEAIVPVASLRGRRQPTIWISRRLSGRDALMATGHDLVISEQFLGWIVAGQLGQEQVSAIVSHALGQQPVNSSALVAVVEVCCAPWHLVSILASGFTRIASRTPLLPTAWRVRWIVFAVAMIESYRHGRWVALVGVTIIALLSWTTGHFANRWTRVHGELGDRRVIAEGFGPTLAAMIRRNSRATADLERAETLNHARLNKGDT
jgi:hypothetical protein